MRYGRAPGAGGQSGEPPSSITATSQSRARASDVNAKHRRRSSDHDDLRPGKHRLQVDLQRALALTRHRNRDHAVGRSLVELVGLAEEQQPRASVDHRLLRLAHHRRLRARTAEPALHGAVGADDRLRADVARRRRPSPHHRGQRERLAGVGQLDRESQDPDVHAVPSRRLGSPTTPDRGATACRCCARRGARARR